MKKLLFIYNAKSGAWNMVLDGAHKLLSPSTYTCSLCHLTFGNFSEKKTWKSFREESKHQMQFLHKDEFESDYPDENLNYPLVLEYSESGFSTFINSEELNSLNNLEELIDLIKRRSA